MRAESVKAIGPCTRETGAGPRDCGRETTHGRRLMCCSCCPRRSSVPPDTRPCNRGSSIRASLHTSRRHIAVAPPSRVSTRGQQYISRNLPLSRGSAKPRIGRLGRAPAATPPPRSRRRSRTPCKPSCPLRAERCPPRTVGTESSPRGRQSFLGGTCRATLTRHGLHSPWGPGCSLLGWWHVHGCCRSRRRRLDSEEGEEGRSRGRGAAFAYETQMQVQDTHNAGGGPGGEMFLTGFNH